MIRLIAYAVALTVIYLIASGIPDRDHGAWNNPPAIGRDGAVK